MSEERKRRYRGGCPFQVGRWCRFLACLAAITMFIGPIPSVWAVQEESIVLEDFSRPDEKNFPQDWEAQRSKTTAREMYSIRQENGQVFLSATSASQRVYKRIAWDPRTHPIVSWRWRVKEVPEDADLLAAVYVSLDTDLMVIPVATKYVWSAKKPKGTLTEGGLFGAAELVVRSGNEATGEWVEERVNAYEDFKKIHDHEPAPQSWGISLLGGPGVEVDFGSLTVSAR